MRLIDADELLVQMMGMNDGWFDPKPAYNYESLVCQQPTIDAAPVKHGRWIENKYGYITCSVCDGFPLEAMTGSLITMLYEPYESEYCPHCGAKMDLKEQKKKQNEITKVVV